MNNYYAYYFELLFDKLDKAIASAHEEEDFLTESIIKDAYEIAWNLFILQKHSNDNN